MHLEKDISPEKETQYWPKKGISVTFKKGEASSIYVAGRIQNSAGEVEEGMAKAPYKGELYYGIHPGDNLAKLYSNLGTPFESDPIWGCAWRMGREEISVTIISSDSQKGFIPGDAFGGVTISNIKPQLQAEEDFKRETERVSLKGTPLSSKEIYEKYNNRIFIVTSFNSRGEPIAQGTGFQFRDNLIATNYHVIKDARSVKVKKMDGLDEIDKEAIIVCIRDDGGKVSRGPYEGPLFLGSRLNDWAVLCSQNQSLPKVETGDSPQPGDAVTVIGNPEGFGESVTTGVVSAIRENSWIQISAPISHGSSGSPVFDSTGKWIGLATLMKEDAQNLNFATPSVSIANEVEAKVKLADANKYPWSRSGADMPLREMDIEKTLVDLIARSDQKDKSLSEIQKNINDIQALMADYEDPTDQSKLLSYLVDIYADGLGDYLSAIKASNRRIEVDKNNYQAWEQQGILLGIKMGNSEEGIPCIQRAIQLAENRIANELSKNQQDYNDRKYQGEDDFEHKMNQDQLTAADNMTHFAKASNALEIGRMYLMLKNYPDAREWLKKAKVWDNGRLYIGQEADAFLGYIPQANAQSTMP
jgi:S1-C subfamily serine protease